jgi:hypothetical protein
VLDIPSPLQLNGKTMTEDKFIMGVVCILLFAVLGLLFWKVARDAKPDWKLATCLAGFSLVCAVLCMLGTGKISLLKYGDASLLIDQKTEKVERLTEKNNHLAGLIGDAIDALSHGEAMSGGDTRYPTNLPTIMNELRKEAGTNAAPSKR